MSTSDPSGAAPVTGQHCGRGFTLIELMITLVVVAILTTIAIPAYTDFIQRSRRTDAMTSLLNVANHQEQYRTRTLTYATSLGQLGISTTSPESYYSLAISTTGSSYFQATATAISGEAQYADTACRSLGIDSRNCHTSTDAANNALTDCSDTPDQRICWKR